MCVHLNISTHKHNNIFPYTLLPAGGQTSLELPIAVAPQKDVSFLASANTESLQNRASAGQVPSTTPNLQFLTRWADRDIEIEQTAAEWRHRHAL